MNIVRMEDQQPETLHEFYRKLGENSSEQYRIFAGKMLQLLDLLDEDDSSLQVRALTSHQNLNLGRVDGTGRITVTAWDRHYQIEYYLSPEQAPWQDARVVGTTSDPEEAYRMIVTALADDLGFA